MQWHSRALTELKAISMINYMCQLDWATLSDTWSNIMLEVAVRVFFLKINIYISGFLVKQIILLD